MVKISVCLIVYNHEKYIKDCLNGAWAQKVNFDYEIIVSEDCSTDRTREICREYQKKYPDKIKLYFNETNLGLIGNWVKSLKLCHGEYIAICEGDDYWTDPLKLKKQVDFLDSHPDFALSSHNVNVIKNDKIIRQYCQSNHPEVMNLKYLLTYGSGGPTCSLVIRNKAIKNLPDWFDKMHSCDWTIQVMAAQHGKMKYFKEIMGVYRKHDKGASFSAKIDASIKGKSDFALPAKYTLEMVEVLKNHFNHKYDQQLNQHNTYWYNYYVNEYLKINDIKKARKYALKIFKAFFPLSYWKNNWLTKKHLLKLVYIFLPYFLQKNITKFYAKHTGKQ